MIPRTLTIQGFLSYREEVEVDFTSFDLACIAGQNGSGKSSLLDAITWVIFGKARKADDSLINMHPSVDTANVMLEFEYETNLYRVQRTKQQGKSVVLEFQIRTPDGLWKPLTEGKSRETQAQIERTLGLDYDTFVNASFFLQGKADQFTQQRPAARKNILANILGLDMWETYRKQAITNRKALELEQAGVDARLMDAQHELSEETERRSILRALEAEHKEKAKTLKTQQELLQYMRQQEATLKEQAKLVQTLSRQLDTARTTLESMETRLVARKTEQESYAQIIDQADEIQKAHEAWQTAQTELETWNATAAQFHEYDKKRAPLVTQIEAERARLTQERLSLTQQRDTVEAGTARLTELEQERATLQEAVISETTELAQREHFEAELTAAIDDQAARRAENIRLRDEMEELKERINTLQQSHTEEATCPLCGQSLEDRAALIEHLQSEGTEMGDTFRENKKVLESADKNVRTLREKLAQLKSVQTSLHTHHRNLDRLETEIEGLKTRYHEWETEHAPKLSAVEAALSSETFAAEARTALVAIDAELNTLGYDAVAHDAVRKTEATGRASAERMRALENARATLEPIRREVGELSEQIKTQRAAFTEQEREHREAQATYQKARENAPNLYELEQVVLGLELAEKELGAEVVMAKQRVAILAKTKKRAALLTEEKHQIMAKISQYKTVERAFGKDGVPALLIEQALPQIEDKANELLDKLSNGTMSVRFITQREYKDKKRDDLKETLDIQISDAAGTRDYEMYSGGEAFRVNFAIRLALSEILAQRAGARLQTLVIDEGFGSQDAAGRQRLIEAINMVRPDFAKILVITHIDELKEAFPARLEVEKTPGGSQVRVVH